MTQNTLEWSLADLVIGFNNHAIIHGISIIIKRGQFIAISGVNGSGKSCLLKTISGSLAPISGTMSVPGQHFASHGALVPQVTDLHLRLPITLAEMVELGLVGVGQSFVREKVSSALLAVGLENRGRQLWQTSSGGERQRALIARALVRGPDLICLDEATSHLDAHGSDQCLEYLHQQCRQQRLAVLAVMHDHGLTERYATHELELAHGHAILRCLS